MSNINRIARRRVSSRVAQFTVEDAAQNVFCFERKLTVCQYLRPFAFLRELRNICRNATRNGVRAAYVQIAGREPIDLV